MNKTALQDQVLSQAGEIRNSQFPGLPLCLNLFKPHMALGTDIKIQEVGVEVAVQLIIDDSLSMADWLGMELEPKPDPDNDVEKMLADMWAQSANDPVPSDEETASTQLHFDKKYGRREEIWTRLTTRHQDVDLDDDLV